MIVLNILDLKNLTYIQQVKDERPIHEQVIYTRVKPMTWKLLKLIFIVNSLQRWITFDFFMY